MRVLEQVLAPGVEDAEDADLCAQVLRVRCNFPQRRSAGSKEEMVKVSGVVLCQEVEFVRNSKDHVKVRGRQ